MKHKYTKILPDISIISFDISAQKFSNKLPFKINLIKSKPPNIVIRPNDATKCIKNFFLLKNLIDKNENNKIIKPI